MNNDMWQVSWLLLMLSRFDLPFKLLPKPLRFSGYAIPNSCEPENEVTVAGQLSIDRVITHFDDEIPFSPWLSDRTTSGTTYFDVNELWDANIVEQSRACSKSTSWRDHRCPVSAIRCPGRCGNSVWNF